MNHINKGLSGTIKTNQKYFLSKELRLDPKAECLACDIYIVSREDEESIILYTEACYVTYKKITDIKCPCGSCLVKTMCGYPCKEFMEFRKVLIELQELECGHGI